MNLISSDKYIFELQNKSSGLLSATPFCDLLETRNFTQSATEHGLISVQGLAVAFDSFMTAMYQTEMFEKLFKASNASATVQEDAVSGYQRFFMKSSQSSHFYSSLGTGKLALSLGYT